MLQPDDWVVVACGATKLDRPAAAEELYTGSYFRATLAWAKSVQRPERIRILSAKFGLVSLRSTLPPYNTTFNNPRSGGAVPISTSELAAQLHKLGMAGRVYVVGGGAYAEALRAAGGSSLVVVKPFAGRMGEQMARMKRSRGRLP